MIVQISVDFLHLPFQTGKCGKPDVMPSAVDRVGNDFNVCFPLLLQTSVSKLGLFGNITMSSVSKML